jgi:hypothetical protein
MIQPAVAGAARLPQAAVATAGAVRDLSDSSLIMRLTRGRGWIGLLCFLLGGIVALNVISLSLSAGAGQVSVKMDELGRQNSALRAQLAEQLSATRVEAAAAALGFAVPDPQDIRYLDAQDDDAERLAKLLDTGSLGSAPPSPTGSYPTDTTSSFAPTASPAPATSSPAPSPTPSAPSPAPSAPSSGGGSTGGVGL